jgi:hypothetical protein
VVVVVVVVMVELFRVSRAVLAATEARAPAAVEEAAEPAVSPWASFAVQARLLRTNPRPSI